MVKIFKQIILMVVIIAFSYTFLPVPVNAEFTDLADFEAAKIDKYVDLSPTSVGPPTDTTDPGSYFGNLFSTFIVLISVLSVIKLMICGITYMTSESITTKGDAKKCIWYIFMGLALILLSVVVLTMINQDFADINLHT